MVEFVDQVADLDIVLARIIHDGSSRDRPKARSS
jgi:hypothetical protein